MAGIPLPKGYHSVNPYILVDGVERLIQCLVTVVGGKEEGGRELTPDGRVGHANVRIGDSVVMLSDASEAYPARPCVTPRTPLKSGRGQNSEPLESLSHIEDIA